MPHARNDRFVLGPATALPCLLGILLAASTAAPAGTPAPADHHAHHAHPAHARHERRDTGVLERFAAPAESTYAGGRISAADVPLLRVQGEGMKHILVALLCLGSVLPAHASIRAVGAERMPAMPVELEGYFAAALEAERLGDPVGRCLAYPGLPGNQWPEGAAAAYCRMTARPKALAAAIAGVRPRDWHGVPAAGFDGDLDKAREMAAKAWAALPRVHDRSSQVVMGECLDELEARIG